MAARNPLDVFEVQSISGTPITNDNGTKWRTAAVSVRWITKDDFGNGAKISVSLAYDPNRNHEELLRAIYDEAQRVIAEVAARLTANGNSSS